MWACIVLLSLTLLVNYYQTYRLDEEIKLLRDDLQMVRSRAEQADYLISNNVDQVVETVSALINFEKVTNKSLDSLIMFIYKESTDYKNEVQSTLRNDLMKEIDTKLHMEMRKYLDTSEDDKK